MAAAATTERPIVLTASTPPLTSSPNGRRRLHATVRALARQRTNDQAVLPGVPFH